MSVLWGERCGLYRIQAVDAYYTYAGRYLVRQPVGVAVLHVGAGGHAVTPLLLGAVTLPEPTNVIRARVGQSLAQPGELGV